MNQDYQSYTPEVPIKKKKSKKPYRKPMVISFFVLLIVGALAALWLPLRPSYSETEKRELTKFPKLTFSALIDGRYFKGIGEWYADTFPLRETFMDVDSKMKAFSGVGDTVNELPNDAADDIPDAEDVSAVPVTPVEQSSSEPEDQDVDDSLIQSLSSVLIVDDAAYEYYNFTKETADRYVTAVSRTANALKGTARVFDIIVPTSMDITLSNRVRKRINTGSQKKAIDYMYAALSPNCTPVEIYDTLRTHRNEYVYFRTDHHWTALGAYYAYRKFASTAELRVPELSEFTEKKFENFVGAFYNDTEKNPALEKNPDTVYAYVPKATNSMEYVNRQGKTVKWNIITDVSTWSRGSRYNTFIGGDNPYSHISNPALENGPSCVVIKESFGNAFVPFLLADYKEIHVIDYRYWNEKLTEFVKEKGVKDVIYINNISATRNASLVKKLDGIS